MMFPAVKAVAKAAFPRQSLIVVIEREGMRTLEERVGNVIYWFIHLGLKGSDEVSFKMYDLT